MQVSAARVFGALQMKKLIRLSFDQGGTKISLVHN
jgi:hypothetical protein